VSSESLSQNEIDLLFSGGGTDQAEPVPVRDPSQDLQVYDFRRPARISKDRKRSLHAMYGLLAKSIESWITGRVRDQIEIELQSVEQLTFGEFVLALPSPCASYIIDVPGGGQQGVIDFGHEFAYFIVDRLLGGAGQHMVPPRTLTPIERMVVRIVADRVASQLSDVWKDYVRLDLDVSGFESIPEMLQVANREDPVLVANLGVSMGDMSSLLLLCLPFATLEKFFTGTSSRRPAKTAGSAEERAQDRGTIETTVRDARVSVGARLPAFKLPLRALAAIEEGGILNTGLPTTSELELFIAGQRRFVGSPGRVGMNLAVRVHDTVKPEPEDLIEAGRESWMEEA
jgi:flagellar motor switch protein FliM